MTSKSSGAINDVGGGQWPLVANPFISLMKLAVRPSFVIRAKRDRCPALDRMDRPVRKEVFPAARQPTIKDLFRVLGIEGPLFTISRERLIS